MSKNRKKSPHPALEATLCLGRLQRSWRPAARVVRSREWEDWLAFAERERERQIHRFRDDQASTLCDARWVVPQPRRAGRPTAH
jgi:hypothetical protein